MKIRKRRGAATCQQEQQQYRGPFHRSSPCAQSLTLIIQQRPRTNSLFNGLRRLILFLLVLAAKERKHRKTGFAFFASFRG
ncbi:MAG TPA: hypothetical protein VKE98_14955 [Gemmataceae bacterium]|nr:hypothetical protein [Gemmataceae bacterium]